MNQPTPTATHPSPASPSAPAKVATSVAHLLGPGVLRARNRIPLWQPLHGAPLLLLPDRLQTLIVYGPADITGAALRLLWQHGVQLAFLDRHATRLLGRLSPPAGHAPSLACWQHWALLDRRFALDQARMLVALKLQAIRHLADYLLRRGNPDLAPLQHDITADLHRLSDVASLESLRGHEGAASARWHAAMRKLFPPTLPYPGRRCHPPTDPVNALLSLGYTLLLARLQAELAAQGLDPLVGVYHQPRPGKPALACDLIEPFRVSVVDHLVLAQVRQGCFQAKHFIETPHGFRLRKEDFRRFLKAFEHAFTGSPAPESFQTQARKLVSRFAAAVRRWVRKNIPHQRPDRPNAPDDPL